MANEAVIISLPGGEKGVPIRFNCKDSVGIEKGALLFFDEPYSLSGGTGIDYTVSCTPFAGIASTEKVANDGSTTLGVWTKGTFDLNTAVAITRGSLVALSGSNLIRPAVALDILSGQVVGKAMEDASANETIKVAVGIY